MATLPIIFTKQDSATGQVIEPPECINERQSESGISYESEEETDQ